MEALVDVGVPADVAADDQPPGSPDRGARIDRAVKAGLDEQEAFLVRSLADLEREHEAGDLTDGDHAELRSRYEDRLAAVRDALVGGRSRVASARRADGAAAPRRRPAVVAGAVVGVVAFAVVAGLLVAAAVGRRDPGESATGADPRGDRQVAAAALADCFALDTDRDADAAANCYLDYVEDNPDDEEGLAYFGWFLFRVGREAATPDAAQLLDTSAVYLDRAVEADPEYADARALRAITRAATGRRLDALADLEVLDTLDPPPGLLELVAPVRESLLEDTTATVPGADDSDGGGPTTTAAG